MAVFSNSNRSLLTHISVGIPINRRMEIGLWLDKGNRESNLWETYTFVNKCVFGISLESTTLLETVQ